MHSKLREDGCTDWSVLVKSWAIRIIPKAALSLVRYSLLIFPCCGRLAGSDLEAEPQFREAANMKGTLRCTAIMVSLRTLF